MKVFVSIIAGKEGEIVVNCEQRERRMVQRMKNFVN
jgi:hypothetical protein